MDALTENAAAVRAAAQAIDAAIEAKGGTTAGGLVNAAAAIQALPSGGQSAYRVSVASDIYRISCGSAPLDYGTVRSSTSLVIVHLDGTSTTFTARQLSELAGQVLAEDAVAVYPELQGDMQYASVIGYRRPDGSYGAMSTALAVTDAVDWYRVLTGQIPQPLPDRRYPSRINTFSFITDYKTLFLASDIEITFRTENYVCFLPGTLVTLSDGTEKPVEDISYSDELLVWDFDNRCYSSARPLWIKKPETVGYWFENTYASGRKLLTTGQSKSGWGHRHFDIERGEFRYTPTTVGDTIMTLDGPDEHISCAKRFGETRFYNIITEKHMNLYANGVLTSCSMNNLYPVRDMKFVKERREHRPFEAYDVPLKYYTGLRLGESLRDIDEVNEYVRNLVQKESK